MAATSNGPPFDLLFRVRNSHKHETCKQCIKNTYFLDYVTAFHSFPDYASLDNFLRKIIWILGVWHFWDVALTRTQTTTTHKDTHAIFFLVTTIWIGSIFFPEQKYFALRQFGIIDTQITCTYFWAVKISTLNSHKRSTHNHDRLTNSRQNVAATWDLIKLFHTLYVSDQCINYYFQSMFAFDWK